MLRWYNKIKTPAAADAVLFATATMALRLPSTVEQTFIEDKIKAATEYCQSYTQRKFIDQTWQLFLTGFPGSSRIPIPHSPLKSVTSVKYIDIAGDEQPWDSSNYTTVSPTVGTGWIEKQDLVSYPVTKTTVNAVTIEYVAGYGAAEDNMPDAVRNAILLLVGYWHRNRDAGMSGSIDKTFKEEVHAALASVRIFTEAVA